MRVILEPQVCFVADGMMRCNWKWHNGTPLYTKSGKWWTWPVKDSGPKQKETTPGKE